MYMCICVYMYICVCVYVSVYVYIYVYVYVCMYICVYVYMYVFIYIYICMYICICTCMYVYIYACMYIYIYVSYIYMYNAILRACGLVNCRLTVCLYRFSPCRQTSWKTCANSHVDVFFINRFSQGTHDKKPSEANESDKKKNTPDYNKIEMN